MNPLSDETAARGPLARLNAQLDTARLAAAPPRQGQVQPKISASWWDRKFKGAQDWSATQQVNFNRAAIEAIEACRDVAASQALHLARLEEELAGVQSLAEQVKELQARSARQELEAAEMRTTWEEKLRLWAQAHSARQELEAAEMRTTWEEKLRLLAQASETSRSDLEALRAEQGERIQHLLDEQRVCIRQISLKASEEAVLSDRARRAVELRLEELARRLEETTGKPQAQKNR